jgi:hypothetical protein
VVRADACGKERIDAIYPGVETWSSISVEHDIPHD